ncbi:type II toxin-antitoxin system HicA family toxin [Cyanobium sp. ULC082]
MLVSRGVPTRCDGPATGHDVQHSCPFLNFRTFLVGRLFGHWTPGFSAVRQNGSHVVMRCGSRGCVVALHRPVKVGTLAGLLRQAPVDVSEFLRVL